MSNPADHLQRYDHLRDLYLRLGMRVVESATTDEVNVMAKRLGFLHHGQLVFNDERDSDCFTDGLIFLTRRRGTPLVEIARDSWTGISADEAQVLNGMVDGRWSIHEVQRGLPEVGLYTRNMWTGAEGFVFARIAGSTCPPGDLLLFRSIACDGLTWASAAVIRLPPQHLDALRAAQEQGTLPNDATLALGGRATDDIVTAEIVLSQTARNADLRAPAPAVNAPRIGRNDPCPCGSGQKYKRCCGR